MKQCRVGYEGMRAMQEDRHVETTVAVAACHAGWQVAPFGSYAGSRALPHHLHTHRRYSQGCNALGGPAERRTRHQRPHMEASQDVAQPPQQQDGQQHAAKPPVKRYRRAELEDEEEQQKRLLLEDDE